VKPAAGIEDYAVSQLDRLLTVLASQVRRAAKNPGPAEIHDLRVSIRRLSQGVLLFGGLFPGWDSKEILKTLKSMMRLTSEVRNRDIALEFLGTSEHAAHRRRLEKERSAYQRQFSLMVRRWSEHDYSTKWRGSLPIGSA